MTSRGAARAPSSPAQEETSAADDVVLTTDDTVQTANDSVEVDASILVPDVIGVESASRYLHDTFGPLVDADYVPGKTLFCEAIAARFEISILTAEELCDELERGARIRFVRTEDGAGWHIHAEPDDG